MSENWRVRTRFVCDAAHDLCNIEADRMEIVDGRLQVYNRNQLVYVADVSQVILAKLTPQAKGGAKYD